MIYFKKPDSAIKKERIIMFKPDFSKNAQVALGKSSMLKKDPLGYSVLSMMAGAFIGVGVLLAFTIGGQLDGQPYCKVIMGLSFGVALSLVVMAGGELFTGNNMVMAIGVMDRKVSISDSVKLWIICWLGNLAGAVILALLYHLTGLGAGPAGAFMAQGALAKMTAGAVPLIARGILCNFLVCLAVWSAGRATSDAGKLIMIFWCLFAFITTGFEHSIANMTLMTVALLNPMEQAVTAGGYFYNLALVTFGNMIGGIVFVALPYYIASRKDD